MLLVVGWSAVVVWLNVTPRIMGSVPDEEYLVPAVVQYGCPWSYAGCFTMLTHGHWIGYPSFRPQMTHSYWPLAGNIAIGLLAVAVLTWASKYLVRAIVAGVRSLLSRSPPDKGNGPSKSN